MKKFLLLMLALACTVSLSGCAKKTALSPDAPVTLTMWHVYGEQADSPMNRLIAQFNETVGREKGIVIDVTVMTNSTKIRALLLDAHANKPGVPKMPVRSSYRPPPQILPMAKSLAFTSKIAPV